MSPANETLGRRIRRHRRSLFMTQAALATACGVTQSAVAQWEKDVAVPHLRNRPAIAGALRTYPHLLFDDIEAAEGVA